MVVCCGVVLVWRVFDGIFGFLLYFFWVLRLGFFECVLYCEVVFCCLDLWVRDVLCFVVGV